MPNPYKIYDKNKGPQWLRGLDKYIEDPASNEPRKKDNETTVRNTGGNRKQIDDATFVGKGRK